jgi:hypothetical protein
VDIAADASAGEDFDTILRLDSAEKLTVNFDFAHFDVGMHDRMLADDEIIVGGNGTLEVAVNAQRAGKLQFTGHICSFVQKSGNLIGLLKTKFHIEAP